jgi:hypothetical protein
MKHVVGFVGTVVAIYYGAPILFNAILSFAIFQRVTQ